MTKFNIPSPNLQIDFSFALDQIREVYLQDALYRTIETIDLSILDIQLSKYVPQDSLKALAMRGLRGEILFPVPCILESNPFILAYYRLLLGFSQKEFYTTTFGISKFKSMEVKGMLSDRNRSEIPSLCSNLIGSACSLLDGIGINRITKELLDDLTLLTVGPQLRGGANVKKGISSIVDVFAIIHRIVEHSTLSAASNKIQLKNAAERIVSIEFAADPDIVIREQMNEQSTRNIIAIEVKGGTDFSNIHNRVGEAEKSHQKAKSEGYVECWTVVNVDKIDVKMAKKESPSTNQFFRISALKSGEGKEYENFKNRIISLTGIKNS